MNTITQSGGHLIRKAVITCCALIALTCVASPARGNTYLFTFTATDLLNALRASEGSTNFNESAYFAIFVQPDPIAVSAYSYQTGSLVSPYTGGPDAWQSNTITDPASPKLGYSGGSPCTVNCTWVQYSKQSGDLPGGQTSVMVLSQADPAAGSNGDFFLNATYFDNVPAPYGWGATTATITTVLNGTNANPIFSFLIDTPLTLSGPVTLKGRASSLRSGSSTTFTTGINGVKEHDGIAFTLSETPTAVPEPGSLALLTAGAAFLAAIRFFKKQSHAGPRGTGGANL